MTKKTAAHTPVPNPQLAPAAALREELRVLNAASEDTTPQKEWLTPEFISMVASVGINLITAATVVGWIDVNNAQEMTKAVTAIATAIGTITANVIIIWKYMAGRQVAKTEAIRAKYQYMEAVAVERMRSNSGW